MLKINETLCTGCGVCTRVCPSGAITLFLGKAFVEQSKCLGCERCIRVCPRGAIRREEESFETIWESLKEIKRKIDYLNQRVKFLRTGSKSREGSD